MNRMSRVFMFHQVRYLFAIARASPSGSLLATVTPMPMIAPVTITISSVAIAVLIAT